MQPAVRVITAFDVFALEAYWAHVSSSNGWHGTACCRDGSRDDCPSPTPRHIPSAPFQPSAMRCTPPRAAVSLSCPKCAQSRSWHSPLLRRLTHSCCISQVFVRMAQRDGSVSSCASFVEIQPRSAVEGGSSAAASGALDIGCRRCRHWRQHRHRSDHSWVSHKCFPPVIHGAASGMQQLTRLFGSDTQPLTLS